MSKKNFFKFKLMSNNFSYLKNNIGYDVCYYTKFKAIIYVMYVSSLQHEKTGYSTYILGLGIDPFLTPLIAYKMSIFGIFFLCVFLQNLCFGHSRYLECQPEQVRLSFRGLILKFMSSSLLFFKNIPKNTLTNT